MELGAFYPFSRNHNTDDAIDQDPVALGPAVVDASRKALTVRYLLLPYLYTLFWHAHADGTTVARPLFFEFPLDRLTYAIDTQFLWGSALMIAPVLTEATERIEVYLPHSLWYDFYSHRLVSGGGKWTNVEAPLDTIPLFIRGGSILPTQAPQATTTLSRQNPFDLIVALNEKGQALGDLYWDDGESIDAYQRSLYNHVQFKASRGVIQSKVVHGKDEELWMRDVTVLGVDRPIVAVTVNGRECSNFTYISDTNVLYIRDLHVNLMKPFLINYQ